jgi:hypothetical protein
MTLYIFRGNSAIVSGMSPVLTGEYYGRNYWRNLFNADPVFGCWHCVEVGCVADVSEEHCTSTTQTTVPAGSTKTMNHRESLKLELG